MNYQGPPPRPMGPPMGGPSGSNTGLIIAIIVVLLIIIVGVVYYMYFMPTDQTDSGQTDSGQTDSGQTEQKCNAEKCNSRIRDWMFDKFWKIPKGNFCGSNCPELGWRIGSYYRDGKWRPCSKRDECYEKVKIKNTEHMSHSPAQSEQFEQFVNWM